MSDDSPQVKRHSRSIQCEDGVSIVATFYEPVPIPENPLVAVIGSATGVSQHFYGSFATYLASKQGTGDACVVVTFDFRGTGDSRPQSLKGG